MAVLISRLESLSDPSDVGTVIIRSVAGETVDPFNVLSATGVKLFGVDINGVITGGGSLTGDVILSPTTSIRNTITPTADNVIPLVVTGHSTNQSVPLLQVFTDPSLPISGFFIVSNGGIQQQCSDGTSPPMKLAVGPNVNANQTALQLVCQTDVSGNSTQSFNINAQSLWFWTLKTTTTNHSAVQFQPSWLDNTEATRKGQFIWQTRDAVGTRTVLTGSTNGSAPTIAFLGAAAVAQQTNGTAAALAAITDANVKSFLTALSNGLVNFGLFAAPA